MHAASEHHDTFADVLATYRTLVERRKTLQAERARCELDLKQAALHSDWYSADKLAEIKERYHAVTSELDKVTREEASLVADHPELREYLEREFAFRFASEDDEPESKSQPGEQPQGDSSEPVLAEEALHGLAGDIVRTIDPYTEADPVAVLLNTLVGFGNSINSTAHARVQHDKHPARLYVVQVGKSSKGRKGTGWSTPRYLLSQCDPDWAKDRIKSGLSSGEGLIYNVRDPVISRIPVKKGGAVYR